MPSIDLSCQSIAVDNIYTTLHNTILQLNLILQSIMLLLLVQPSQGVFQQEIAKISPSLRFHKMETLAAGGRFKFVASMTQ